LAEQELICIVCPASCSLKVAVEPSGEIKVSGNLCSRGADYAKHEAANPLRYVMSVVKVKHGGIPTVSVITSKPVPKKCISEIMKATANVEVEAPVEMGQIVLQNICGADLVTTRKVKRIVLSSPTYL